MTDVLMPVIYTLGALLAILAVAVVVAGVGMALLLFVWPMPPVPEGADDADDDIDPLDGFTDGDWSAPPPVDLRAVRAQRDEAVRAGASAPWMPVRVAVARVDDARTGGTQNHDVAAVHVSGTFNGTPVKGWIGRDQITQAARMRGISQR